MNLSTETFDFTLVGDVYGSPTHPGTVAPTGERSTVHLSGTISDIGEQYSRWSDQPVRSSQGINYPRRFIHGQRPLDHIFRTLESRHGSLCWGAVCAPIVRLLGE